MNALSAHARQSKQLSWTLGHGRCHQLSRAIISSCLPARHSPRLVKRGNIQTQFSRQSFTGNSSSSTPQQQSVLQRAFANPPQWGPFLGSLAVAGAVFGTALDGIHSRVGLQVRRLIASHTGTALVLSSDYGLGCICSVSSCLRCSNFEVTNCPSCPVL